MNTQDISTAIEDTMRYVLYEKDELDDGQAPDDAVLVGGIVSKFGFHPGRLNEKRGVILEMAEQLSDDFQEKKGGGWTFLGFCQTKDGEQWGGHQLGDQLFCLLKGLRMADWCMPRVAWSNLPGGMPYLMINLEGWDEGEMPMEVFERTRKGAQTGGGERDYTDADDVVPLLRASRTESEWNAICLKVKMAGEGGGYPSWWYEKVIMSGLSERTGGISVESL